MSVRGIFVNTLTFSRVPLIVAWLLLAIAEEFRSSTALIFLAGASMFLAGITDAFDGALARRWNVVSPLGKMADPLMDKVFYVVVFPSLAWLLLHQGDGVHSLVMLAFAILYILRDLWVTFLRSVGSLYGADGAAMWIGKVRTALSFPAAGWVYVYIVFNDAACLSGWRTAMLASCYVVEALMIALNLLSLVTYTKAYSRYLKKAMENPS
ncbi:MAG: CDP-alcohol phosphatidyltransferase family protein [Kiritimatiellae bacterium]|nr:CDP-alcohol phosphatidyltransferase family protein [Kiritimatiellia bacterium]